MKKKKILLIVATVLGALLLGIAGLLAVTFGDVKPLEDGESYGRIEVVAVNGFVAAYLVDVGGGKFALVDAGIDPDAATIIDRLEKRGATARDVDVILLTHGHSDHVGGANAFPEAKIYLHEGDHDLAAGKVAAKGLLTRFTSADPPVVATEVLKDRDVVRVGEANFRVYHTPGHTPGTVVFVLDGVMLMGDAAQVRPDDTLAPPPSILTDDPAVAIESVRRLAATLEHDNVVIERIVGGHSGSTDRVEALANFTGE